MDHNVTKSTFCIQSLEFEFFEQDLSLKQLIEKQLLSVITIFLQQHIAVKYRQKIIASLTKKIILCSNKTSSKELVYRCAISLEMAHKAQLSPLSVAQCLVVLLISQVEKNALTKGLEITVLVTQSGFIDFVISDRQVSIWLNLLIAKIKVTNCFQLPKKSNKKRKIQAKIFPLQYIYSRCFCLLKLGIQEQTISLETTNKSNLQWQPQLPPFTNLPRTHIQEFKVIRHIALIVDFLAIDEQYNEKNWSKFTADLSADWLQFRAECPFCGDFKLHNPTLATARLGLIFLLCGCLEQIFITKLKMIPSNNSKNLA